MFQMSELQAALRKAAKSYYSNVWNVTSRLIHRNLRREGSSCAGLAIPASRSLTNEVTKASEQQSALQSN